MLLLVRLVIIACLFTVHLFANATTFTVTNTNDSGLGSLRQAIRDANSNSGIDNIAFNIPGVGPHEIQLDSALTKLSDAVIIDGFTQAGVNNYAIILDGNGRNIYPGIELGDYNLSAATQNLNGTIIKGIQFQGFGSAITTNIQNISDFRFEKNKVEDCGQGLYIGNQMNAFISDCVFQNSGTAISLYNNSNCNISFNLFQNCNTGIYGSEIELTSIKRNKFFEITNEPISINRFKNSSSIEENNIYNSFNGVVLSEPYNISIKNNLIGVDSTYAATGITNNNIQLTLYGLSENVEIKNNTLVKADKNGIYVVNNTNKPVYILSNRIGINSIGTSLGNKQNGIEIIAQGYVFIGDGTSEGENIIANNLKHGVSFEGSTSTSNVNINRNKIYNNALEPIYLGALDNYKSNSRSKKPQISKVLISGANHILEVWTETNDIRLEVYESDASNKNLLNYITPIQSQNKGNGVWNITIPITSTSSFYTVTATGMLNNTSEVGFNLNKALVVTNTNDSGPGSLREALKIANALADTSAITFNIPGAGPHVIKPVDYLPYLLYSTVIDGGSRDNIIIDGSLSSHGLGGLTIGDLSGSNQAKRTTVKYLTIRNFSNGLVVQNYHNVILSDLIIYDITNNAISLTRTQGYSIVKDIEVSNSDYSIICFNGDSLLIKDSYFHHMKRDGLSFGGSSSFRYIEVIGNTISHNINDGISSSIGGPSLINIYNNLIFSNGNYGISVGRGAVKNIKGNVIGLDSTHRIAKPNKIGISTWFTWDVFIDSNIVSGNLEEGIIVSRNKTFLTRNYIGTNEFFDKNIGNGKSGIKGFVDGNLIVGNSSLDSANVIGNNLGHGIELTYGLINSNYIGVSPSFSDIGNLNSGVNTYSGVLINNNYIGNNEVGIDCRSGGVDIINNKIGGNYQNDFGNRKWGIVNPYFSNIKLNIIANNDSGAVKIKSNTSRFKSSKSTYYGNPQAIYFESTTSNQNKSAPQNITTSKTGSGLLFNGTSTKKDTIEIFTSSATPQTATKYLGYTVADASGNWSYTLPAGSDYNPLTTSYFITTATDTVGNTSRLSNLITVEACQLTVTNTNDSGVGSLRDCIECANVKPGNDTVRFAIPGAGPYKITPTVVYAGYIIDSLYIDGSSQVASGLGSGLQTIILDGNERAVYGAITFFNARVSNIHFQKISVAYGSSIIENCVLDSVSLSPTNFYYFCLNNNFISNGVIRNSIIKNNEVGISSSGVSAAYQLNCWTSTFNYDFEVSNCTFYNVKTAIYSGFNARNVLIKNNKIGLNELGDTVAVNEGIYIRQFPTHVIIEDNIIVSDATINPHITLYSSIDSAFVRNNQFIVTSPSAAQYPIMNLYYVNKAKIENNVFSYTKKNAIEYDYVNSLDLSNNSFKGLESYALLYKGSNTSNRIRISGNVFQNTKSNIVKILNSNYTTINNNTCSTSNMAPYKIFADLINLYIDSLSGNTIANASIAFNLIAVRPFGTTIKITNNNFTSNDTAVFATNGSYYFDILNNSISQNKFGLVSTNGSFSNALVKGNIFDANSEAAIYCSNGLNNSQFVANTFTGNNNAMTLFNGCTGNIIKQNSFSQNTSSNILLYNGASQNRITENTILNYTNAKAIDLTLNNGTFSPGNNSKDTASITTAVKQPSGLILSGTGIDDDSIEVFTNNKTKENALTFIGKAKVVGGTWSLTIPSGAGYNPLANNHYVVTATDVSNNTSQLSNFYSVILQLTSNQLNLLPKNGGICLGEFYTLDAVIDSVEYRWYQETLSSTPVAITKTHPVTVGGNYIIEVEDSFGNTAGDTIAVIANSEPLAADFLMPSTTGIDDVTVVIDISYTQPDSTIWNWGGATAVKGIDNYTLSFPSTGTYTVQLISYLGACAKIKTSTINVVPGRLQTYDPIVYPYNIKSVAAGPNPVTDELNVVIDMANEVTAELMLYNQMGAILQTISLDTPSYSQSATISLLGQPSGIYFVRILSGPDVRVIKVVK